MSETIKSINDCTPKWYKLLLLASTLLVIAGLIIPPVGVVDASVIAAVGELSLTGLFGMIPYYLQSSNNIKLSKGSTSVEISKDKEND